MWGSHYVICSPLSSKTSLKTPWAAGCCGPKFIWLFFIPKIEVFFVKNLNKLKSIMFKSHVYQKILLTKLIILDNLMFSPIGYQLSKFQKKKKNYPKKNCTSYDTINNNLLISKITKSWFFYTIKYPIPYWTKRVYNEWFNKIFFFFWPKEWYEAKKARLTIRYKNKKIPIKINLTKSFKYNIKLP